MYRSREEWRYEQFRRRRRHDWKRWLHPDWERRAAPSTREFIRAMFAEEARADAEWLRRRKRSDAEALSAATGYSSTEDVEPQPERLLDEIRLVCRELRQLIALRRALSVKYRSDQPRVPAGSPEGGQWTSGDRSLGQAIPRQFEKLTTARDQSSRTDISELQDIANQSHIRARIDEAWNASQPYTTSPREHGFWICRNEATGEVFTRPFANPGSTRNIVPGEVPSDAVGFFHTHPLAAELGGIPGPSQGDYRFATRVGLPGILQSHRGMYYFGPTLRPFRTR